MAPKSKKLGFAPRRPWPDFAYWIWGPFRLHGNQQDRSSCKAYGYGGSYHWLWSALNEVEYFVGTKERDKNPYPTKQKSWPRIPTEVSNALYPNHKHWKDEHRKSRYKQNVW